MSAVVNLRPVKPADAKALVETAARELTSLKRETDSQSNSGQWTMARAYVGHYHTIKDAYRQEKRKATPQRINKDIRQTTGYEGPGAAFMSHALRTCEVMGQVGEDFFASGHKNYNFFMRIANSRTTLDQKRALFEWLDTEPTQAELRQRIRELVDGQDEYGFQVKLDNYWRFDTRQPSENGHFDGGISDHVVCNLYRYLTDTGDTIIDPMAGSGRSADVIKRYRYFSEDSEAEGAGPRTVLMADIDPCRDDIIQADAIQDWPFPRNIASLVLLDPPYWKIAEGKYGFGGKSIEEWTQALGGVISQSLPHLKPGGFVAIILDDYLRTHARHPLALLAAMEAVNLGLTPYTTFYNHHCNYCFSTGPQDIARNRKSRNAMNGVKVIHVFRAGEP